MLCNVWNILTNTNTTNSNAILTNTNINVAVTLYLGQELGGSWNYHCSITIELPVAYEPSIGLDVGVEVHVVPHVLVPAGVCKKI
jgi:hypothetical protein